MLILCPTRGRPANARRLHKAVAETCRRSEVLFLVDNDDPHLGGYLEGRIRVEVGPRLRLGPTLNAAVLRHSGDDQFFGFLGDDHLPRTPGWDVTLERQIESMGGGFAYGNDLIQGPNLPTAIVMSADVPTVLGHMVPAGLTHLFIDNAWKDLGRECGHLAYRDDVVIEHMHPLVGKGEQDETYAAGNAPGMWHDDEQKYIAWRDTDLTSEAAQLRRLWDSR